MALGYEGYVTVKVSGVEDIALCTGASVPENRSRIESSAAYGGSKELAASPYVTAIGTPRLYDWSQADGSVEFELTENFFLNQIVAWIHERQKAATIKLFSRKDNLQSYTHCYWKSINFGASAGGLVNGSIDFSAIQRDDYAQGGDYKANNKGMRNCSDLPTKLMPPFLNPSSALNVNPVPSWNTLWSFGDNNQEFTDWSVNLSQDVVKFFVCETNELIQPPKFIAVGPLTVTLSVTQMPLTGVMTAFAAANEVEEAVLHIGSQKMTFGKLELSQSTDAVASRGSLVPVTADYNVYEIRVNA